MKTGKTQERVIQICSYCFCGVDLAVCGEGVVLGCKHRVFGGQGASSLYLDLSLTCCMT